MRKQDGRYKNNVYDIMTCCNIFFIRVGHKRYVLLNDIISGKAIVFHDDNRNEAELWKIFSNCGYRASSAYVSGVPGSVVIIGNKTESIDYIRYDWTDGSPIFSFMSVSLYACYVTVENDQRIFIDTLSSKKLVFENLNANNCLQKKLDLFYSTDGPLYVHTSGRYIIFSAEKISDGDNFINLDARKVYVFSSYENLYNILYNSIGMDGENES